MEQLPDREQVDIKYRWHMEDLYHTDEDWERDYDKLSHMETEITGYQGKLGESAQSLLEALKTQDAISKRLEKVYVYASQKSHENMADDRYQDFASRASSLMMRLEAAGSFLVPELLQIPEEKIEQFLEKNQELRVYRRYLKNLLRQKPHILSGDTENLLAQVQEIAHGPSDIFAMFNNADLKFPAIRDEQGQEVELTHGRFIMFMESRNREVRREAFEALYSAYGAFKNTLAATFRSNVKQAAFYAKVRKYESSLQMALDDSNIPEAVYNNLIDTVRKNLSLLHRYAAIRKEKLGLEELHMYDLYVPMVPGTDRKIPYEEAKKIVKDGLAPLGEDYQALLQKGYDSGWIDVYENKGKRSGAYSWGAYGTHPYVLLNYQDNLNNVFTLAHEMGHALHSWYSDETQPYIYAGYKIFVAEVASTCNESLLIHHLMDTCSDPKEKQYLINYFLEQFRGTLFRQTMFAEFEKKVHQMEESGQVLTPDTLCDTYYQLNQEYFGPDTVVDPQIALEWARIPHFYTPFYVYQYATGFSAAIAISRRILSGDKHTLDGYKKFLRGGSSMDPIDLLRLAGVDMTSPEPIRQALTLFGELLNEFA